MFITVDVLKEILDRVPGDFEVEYMKDDISHPISDRVEVDISCKKIILKS